jgi:hypothetical protein
MDDAKGEKSPPETPDTSTDGEPQASKPKQRNHSSKSSKSSYDSSIVWALYRTFLLSWWTAGFLKLVAGVLSFSNERSTA